MSSLTENQKINIMLNQDNKYLNKKLNESNSTEFNNIKDLDPNSNINKKKSNSTIKYFGVNDEDILTVDGCSINFEL